MTRDQAIRTNLHDRVMKPNFMNLQKRRVVARTGSGRTGSGTAHFTPTTTEFIQSSVVTTAAQLMIRVDRKWASSITSTDQTNTLTPRRESKKTKRT